MAPVIVTGDQVNGLCSGGSFCLIKCRYLLQREGIHSLGSAESVLCILDSGGNNFPLHRCC